MIFTAGEGAKHFLIPARSNSNRFGYSVNLNFCVHETAVDHRNHLVCRVVCAVRFYCSFSASTFHSFTADFHCHIVGRWLVVNYFSGNPEARLSSRRGRFGDLPDWFLALLFQCRVCMGPLCSFSNSQTHVRSAVGEGRGNWSCSRGAWSYARRSPKDTWLLLATWFPRQLVSCSVRPSWSNRGN